LRLSYWREAVLTPDLVAMSLKRSRAALYRAFARDGESGAVVIWATRLDHAWRT
jgi:hypothetical protein